MHGDDLRNSPLARWGAMGKSWGLARRHVEADCESSERFVQDGDGEMGSMLTSLKWPRIG
jgi:hypothetical protein